MAQAKGKPKSPQEQRAIQLLRQDPNMRTAFVNKVAAPIAANMSDYGMTTCPRGPAAVRSAEAQSL